ncbi:MAG: SDR family oxidoreductase [Actinomycetota bacterium]
MTEQGDPNAPTGEFADKVVVVTGGASGMGAATAREFAARGATLVLVDLNADGAERVAGECRAGGAAEVSTRVGDVSQSEFCDAVIDTTVADHGRIDVLVTAAGTIHRADSLGTTDGDWARVMGVNVDGMFFLCRAALRHMTAARSGAIVNFGSIWGGVGSAGSTAYCVSKGAVHQLTRALALDHVEDGIRVNAVAPGEVNTPMLSSQRDAPPTAEYLQALADATIPMKRLAEPEEIARVVVFLASDDASYITGEIVHVDAGYTAR